MPDEILKSNPWMMVAGALFCFLLAAVGLYSIREVYLGFVADHDVGPRAILGTLCILAAPLGMFGMVSAAYGLPVLRVSSRGVKLDALLRKAWADWDSLGRFEEIELGGKVKTSYAQAKVVGPNASANLVRSGVFQIMNGYGIRTTDLVARLNRRAVN